MQWSSLSEFFFMSGHGLFVFLAYGLVIGALGIEVYLARRKVKTFTQGKK